nr:MAG: hypothetical protein 1 [Leviviridae sp.]
MPTRSRNRSDVQSGTESPNSSGNLYYMYMTSLQESCIDVVGEGDNKPFDHSIITRSGGLLNYASTSKYGRTWKDCPCKWQQLSPSVGHIPTDRPSADSFASTILKRTNPSRASVDLAVTLGEMRELPSLVKEGWDLSQRRLFNHVPRWVFRNLGRAAKLNLMVQFGILPLISDAQKLLIFQDLVDQRMKELERLSSRGLRRTISLGSWNASSTDSSITYFHSNGVTFKGYLKRTTVEHVRGHARWHLDEPFAQSDSELRALATRIVTGQTVDLLTAYELMPWSWLIDYFSNLGDYISSKRNLVGATPSLPAVMVNSRTLVSHPTIYHDNGQGYMTAIHNVREDKKRQYASAGLNAYLPALSGKQMSILGSLSVLKGLR